ncbi:MAG: spore coat protein U domain-containing protein [Deltaproteobacteria bacterium]|nr:spore coat protein U domain-containing protein [Deltaproteobacteria bacterium]
MKKLIGIVILAVTMTAASAMAFTETSTIVVSANVSATCRITSVNDVNFGTYDPTDDSADDIDGVGQANFRCTKGVNYDAYFARTGNMSDGSNSLAYQLYPDNTYTTELADAASAPVASTTNAVQTIDIYGLIPKAQDVPAGAYSENVTFTIDY